MLHVVSREAVRQICRVFRELLVHVVTENAALVDRIQHLETEMTSQVKNNSQTVYKIQASGQSSIQLLKYTHVYHHMLLKQTDCFVQVAPPSHWTSANQLPTLLRLPWRSSVPQNP